MKPDVTDLPEELDICDGNDINGDSDVSGAASADSE